MKIPDRLTVTPLDSALPEWARLQLDLRKWMSGWVDYLVQRHTALP